MLINPSETCDLSERTIRRAVCQAPRRREVPRPTQSYYKNLVETHTHNLDENVHKHTQFSTRLHIYIQQSRRVHTSSACISSRYVLQSSSSHTHLDELCTTTTISTIHTATITDRISTSIQMISTRNIHETGKITKRLHIVIMHDII